MRPRFLADADFNQKIVRGLRRREPLVDILDAHQSGVIGVGDPDISQLPDHKQHRLRAKQAPSYT